MNKIKDGGPAFPPLHGSCLEIGMSLRDWFAGQALSGILANPTVKSWDDKSESPEQLAAVESLMAFKVADAMLAEREKV